MIYVIQGDFPDFFVKASSPEEAKAKFRVGLVPKCADKLLVKAKIEELTLSLLEKLAPDEFTLSDDTSF